MFKRIIASLLLDKKKLVKGENFKDHKVVGYPKTFCKSLGFQNIDEIFICDLNSYRDQKTDPDFQTLNEISSSTMTPLTFGGGLNTLEKIKKCFKYGADKIYLSTILYKNLDLANQAAFIFGSQSVVAGINVIKENKKLKIYENRNIDFYKWVAELSNAGIGEIKVNFVNQEGSSEGFDLLECKKIISTTKLPLIFEGGLGSLKHIADAFRIGINSVSVGKMISFEDNNIFKIKQFLKNQGFKVRLS